MVYKIFVCLKNQLAKTRYWEKNKIDILILKLI